MASDVYSIAKFELAKGSLDWLDLSNVFRCLLVTPAYVFSSVHEDVADIIASEVSDASYARQDVTGRAATHDIPGNRGIMDADNVLFANLDAVTVGGAVIYKQIGGDDLTPGNDVLVAFIDLPSTTATGNNFLVEFFVDGIVALTAC